MGLTELILILFVALILFGPEDLPVIARTLGKAVYQVRKYTDELTREFQNAMEAPSKAIDDAFKDKPSPTAIAAEKKEEGEEFLTYETSAPETSAPEAGKEANPLADLPSEIVSYPKDSQAGE
jgi:sec-independent protein translocase protein TatA